jgi:hypothetical protein
MKAIVRETYGSPEVLHLKDVSLPTVGDSDVLARATGLDSFRPHQPPLGNCRIVILRGE